MKHTHLAGILCACVMPFAFSSISHATILAYTDQAGFLAALPGSTSTQNSDSLGLVRP